MRQAGVNSILGIGQLLAWGSSFYLPAVLAAPLSKSLGCGESTVYLAFSCAMGGSALVGPLAGRAIDRLGGRPVLIATSLLFAAGLALLSQVESELGLFLAWAVIGMAMGAGLYEAAFATVVRLYGTASGDAITVITLFGGFASTVGWPLSAWMEGIWGWRGACLGWALIHLSVSLPLHLALPRRSPDLTEPPTAEPHESDARGASPSTIAPGTVWSESRTSTRWATGLLAFLFASTWFVTTAFAAHGPRLLLESDVSLEAAVWLGALVGPAQVAGRLLQLGPIKRVDPLRVAAAASLGHPLGVLALLGMGPAWAVVFVLLHGAGGGLMTISRGALPLRLFGPVGYGARQGVLMIPTRIAQSVAPYAFGLAVDAWGAQALWLSLALSVAGWAAVRALDRR